MLAPSHVIVGVTCGIAWYAYTDQPLFYPLLFFAVFGSLLPDIDHPRSEVSKMVPLVHGLLPHRGVTHSLLGLGLVWLLIQYVSYAHSYVTYALLVVCFLSLLYVWRFIGNKTRDIQDMSQGFFSKKQIVLFRTLLVLGSLAGLGLASYAVVVNQLRTDMGILFLIGYGSHLLGDWLTKEGIPLFWPLSQRFGLRLFRTGTWVEGLISFVCICISVWLVYQGLTNI